MAASISATHIDMFLLRLLVAIDGADRDNDAQAPEVVVEVAIKRASKADTTLALIDGGSSCRSSQSTATLCYYQRQTGKS